MLLPGPWPQCQLGRDSLSDLLLWNIRAVIPHYGQGDPASGTVSESSRTVGGATALQTSCRPFRQPARCGPGWRLCSRVQGLCHDTAGWRPSPPAAAGLRKRHQLWSKLPFTSLSPSASWTS